LIFAYYVIVAVGYLVLAAVDFHASQVLVPFVVVMLLAPAVLGEVMRIKDGD
jgi:hypothetical protein